MWGSASACSQVVIRRTTRTSQGRLSCDCDQSVACNRKQCGANKGNPDRSTARTDAIGKGRYGSGESVLCVRTIPSAIEQSLELLGREFAGQVERQGRSALGQ